MDYLEQLRDAGLFDVRAPRYTSFPPADRFVPAEGQLHHRRWLNDIPHGSKLSVYIHIPFCRKICWFCACRTQAVECALAIHRYLDVLKREIELIKAELPDHVTLSHLNIGGGTPTLLSADQMNSLLDILFETFPKGADFEFSVDVDATHADQGLLNQLAARGMNRAVIGVQDYDPVVQKHIGRDQSFEQTASMVRGLRTAGVDNLDMELLFGLPAQSSASIAQTTQQMLALDPDRVALCEYVHMPSVAKRQILIDPRQLPNSEAAYLMSRAARQILLTDGYEAVGTDHFARPGDSFISACDNGTLRRDFQGYSDAKSHAMIGLGASAISRFPQGFIQNTSATAVYSSNIENGRLSANQGYRLTETDRVVAFMVEMLMCQFEIDINRINRTFPGSTAIVQWAVGKLGTLFKPHVTIDRDYLRISPPAHPLARLISSSLDQISEEAGAL